MMNHKILVPLMRDPRFKEEEKKKYPKHLYPAKGVALRMNDKGFYYWQVEKSTGKHAFFLVMLVLGMITFLLFNIWPLWLKIGLWYFSFYTLVILVGIIIFRGSVWLLFFHFGLDIWIMPNFFNDDVPFLDSFRPLI